MSLHLFNFRDPIQQFPIPAIPIFNPNSELGPSLNINSRIGAPMLIGAHSLGSPIAPGTFECVPNWQLLQFNCFNSFNSYWQLDFNTGGRGTRGNCQFDSTSSIRTQDRPPDPYIPSICVYKMTIRKTAMHTTTA